MSNWLAARRALSTQAFAVVESAANSLELAARRVVGRLRGCGCLALDPETCGLHRNGWDNGNQWCWCDCHKTGAEQDTSNDDIPF